VKLADVLFLLFIFLTACVSCDLATRRDAAERLLGVLDSEGDVLPLAWPCSAALVLTVDRTLPVGNDPSAAWN